MSFRHRILALPLALAFRAGGLAPAASAETHVVQMTSVDFVPQFVPAALNVLPGDTVRWVNVDPTSIDHSTCSGTGSTDPIMGQLWNSGAMASAESFEITFDDEGEYEYFSVLHEFENMFGVVRVSDGSTDIGDGIEDSTWGHVKNLFAGILPRD